MPPPGEGHSPPPTIQQVHDGAATLMRAGISIFILIIAFAAFFFYSDSIDEILGFGEGEVKEGVYALTGSAPGVTTDAPEYFGTVTIMKVGETYVLHWQIGEQVQTGIGIVDDDVLSVSYLDTSDTVAYGDMGVVSYKVASADTLEGKWASMYGSGVVGEEKLVWQSGLPATVYQQPWSAGGAAEMDNIVNALEYEASRAAGDTSANPYGDVYVDEAGNTTNVYVE